MTDYEGPADIQKPFLLVIIFSIIIVAVLYAVSKNNGPFFGTIPTTSHNDITEYVTWAPKPMDSFDAWKQAGGGVDNYPQ